PRLYPMDISGYYAIRVFSENDAMQVSQIAYSSFATFWIGQTVNNANAQRCKKAVLYQTTTNETDDIGFRIFRLSPLFKKSGEGISNLSNLRNILEVALGNPHDV